MGTFFFLFGIGLLLTTVIVDLVSMRRRFGRLMQRACMGKQWRRAYPQASKQSIRRFLDIFTSAFSIRARYRLCFAPDDRITDLYRAMTSDLWKIEEDYWIEDCELEYGIDPLADWNDDLTIGEAFERTLSRSGTPEPDQTHSD